MFETRFCQFWSNFKSTHSSQSPQWSGCCCQRHQGGLSGPCRPPPPLRDDTSLGWIERYLFELLNLAFKLFWTLQDHLQSIIVLYIRIESTFDFTLMCESPPSSPGLSSTICTISTILADTHRTPQVCRWSQRGSGQVSLWQQLQWEEEQDESLPGEGKGGIVQLAGKTSTSVSVWAPYPPVIIRPAQWKIYFLTYSQWLWSTYLI